MPGTTDSGRVNWSAVGIFAAGLAGLLYLLTLVVDVGWVRVLRAALLVLAIVAFATVWWQQRQGEREEP